MMCLPGYFRGVQFSRGQLSVVNGVDGSTIIGDNLGELKGDSEYTPRTHSNFSRVRPLARLDEYMGFLRVLDTRSGHFFLDWGV